MVKLVLKALKDFLGELVIILGIMIAIVWVGTFFGFFIPILLWTDGYQTLGTITFIAVIVIDLIVIVKFKSN